MDAFWRQLEAQIQARLDTSFRLESHQPVGGGCINQTLRLRGSGQDLFIKLTDARELDMFAAELEGLTALAQAEGGPRVPRPLWCDRLDGNAYLLMEYIPMGSAPGAARELGRRLARLHSHDQGRYGWHRDNTIGSTPQSNDPRDDWVDFWRSQRLGPQLDFAQRKGAGSRVMQIGERLMEGLDRLLEGHHPNAAPLHGDLWGGNWSADDDGQPVLFDPAFYYGDPETDLAMTELFGGFAADFYAAYFEIRPRAPEYALRKRLYNLYHILNHFNLFGGGYLGQATAMMEALLAEI